MKNATSKRPKPTSGFAISLQPDTDLGLAMLIAEDEEGHYGPVAVVASIREAKEVAESDMRGRMRSALRSRRRGLRRNPAAGPGRAAQVRSR